MAGSALAAFYQFDGFIEGEQNEHQQGRDHNHNTLPGDDKIADIERREPATGLPHCNHLMDQALSLPIYHGLDADHMGYICEQLDALSDEVERRAR